MERKRRATDASTWSHNRECVLSQFAVPEYDADGLAQQSRDRNVLSPRANIPEGCNQRYALALTYLPFLWGAEMQKSLLPH